MRHINTIIIHCSDTYTSMDIGYDEIRQWHVVENGWDDVGYHSIIRRDGTIEAGRPVGTPGEHAKGYNHDSIGICMVGGKGDDNEPDCNFTSAQWAALKELCLDMMFMYNAEIIGHRDVSHKACPCFDVKTWASTLINAKDI